MLQDASKSVEEGKEAKVELQEVGSSDGDVKEVIPIQEITKNEVKEEFAQKMVNALDEMRSEIRAEVLSEMIESNPELQVLEKIKELVAPTLNEEYFGNIYAEEIQTLRESNMKLEEATLLEEGAETLAGLIAPYSERTQNIILAMIKEGNSEEITEQFYELIESLKEAEDDEEIDDEDEDDDEDFDADFDEDDEDDVDITWNGKSFSINHRSEMGQTDPVYMAFGTSSVLSTAYGQTINNNEPLSYWDRNECDPANNEFDEYLV